MARYLSYQNHFSPVIITKSCKEEQLYEAKYKREPSINKGINKRKSNGNSFYNLLLKYPLS